MSQVYQEARSLSSKQRARLLSKLLAEDLPAPSTDEAELARREEEARSGRVVGIEVTAVMKEARALAGIPGKAPALSRRPPSLQILIVESVDQTITLPCYWNARPHPPARAQL